uniref:Uncharacterized protein n=1 Tax=Caenorhabditis japonica TaxID=281687 RepID=A0A8R1HVT6_CAEJA
MEEEDAEYAGQPTSAKEEYVDDEPNAVYYQGAYFYDVNDANVVYEDQFEEFAGEVVYQEQDVPQAYVSAESIPSTSRSTSKPVLIKENYAPSTVLLTPKSLEAENAQFESKPGKKSRTLVKLQKEVKNINQDGSTLNRNLPGMKNMFKVMTESVLKKADEFLKTELIDPEEENQEKSLKDGVMEGGDDREEEAEEDDDTFRGSETPPAMERLGEIDGNEFLDNHFDQWPLYSNQAIDFKEACELLIGIRTIDEEKVCKTLPLEFKHEGTFIIDTRAVHDLINDKNGAWDRPSGKSRYFRENEFGDLVRADDGKGHLKKGLEQYTYKIILKRYESKVTRNSFDGKGHFQKKLYTATKASEKIDYVIITYSWCSGRPWHFVPPKEGAKKLVNWEKKSFEKVNMTEMPQMVSAFYEGFNIYSHCIISFDEAVSIVLGATVIDSNKLSSSVPLGYRQNGTFVIDLKRMGHCLLELRRDDNGLWHKPSGFARFYRFADNGDAIRVDKAGKLPAGTEYDVKVCSKRYEHTQVDKKFVRKIYTTKGRDSDVFPGSPDYAVIVYYWKGEPIQFEPSYKQNMVHTDKNKEFARFQQMADEETEFVEASRIIDDEPNEKQIEIKRARFEVPPMKMALIRREMENQERFALVLDRAESLLGLMEQRFGVVEEQVYATADTEWSEQQIVEEEVIHDYH